MSFESRHTRLLRIEGDELNAVRSAVVNSRGDVTLKSINASALSAAA